MCDPRPPRQGQEGRAVIGTGRARALLLATLAAALAAGCGAGSGKANGATLRIVVGILPQKYFVERVGGDRVTVEALVQPGQDPHTYEPTPRQVAGLADAKLYFQIGLGFENALVERMSSMKGLRVVDTRDGITLRPLDPGSDPEEAGPGGLDPHIWMDPALVTRQAATIRDGLIAADPSGRAAYEAGYASFSRDLDAVAKEIAETLAPYRGKELLVYHPAFGYFAQAFGLKQVAVETGGKEPSAQQLARLIDLARSRGIRVVFVQPQFSQAGARAVAEAIGGAVIPMDDLAFDYIANLRRVATEAAKAIGSQGGAQ
jgi:zinc transport system substrate-binding protein